MPRIKKNAKKYECKVCDFVTFKNSNYLKHISTRKHKNRTNIEPSKKFICEGCGKVYTARNSLWYHKKKCTQYNKQIVVIENETDAEETPQMKEMMEMMKKLMTENEKLTELVKKMPGEMPPSVNLNNTNSNQYYINVFLNEICKDAMNINDFVKSLMIGVDELELAKTKGLAEGVSSLMVNGLNKLEISQRPIHCTDARRKTL